jgi:hypothetical protein
VSKTYLKSRLYEKIFPENFSISKMAFSFKNKNPTKK